MEIIIILAMIAAAAGIEAFIYFKFGAKGLTYKATLNRLEVFEGENVSLTEELSNSKPLPLPFVKTEIVAPDCLDFGVKTQESKERLCYIPSVFSLKAKEKCTRTRNIKCGRRGVFELGASSLYGGDLFGFSGFTLPAGVKETLTVLPTPLSADDFEPSSRLLYGDILTTRFICEDPFLISGAHEYTGREPMNSIFWNGSARTGRLLALNRDHTTSARLLIILDFQRRKDILAPAHEEVCELLIKAAALAMEQSVSLGAEFALSVNLPEREDIKVRAGEEFRLEQLRRLAKIKPDCNCSLEEFLAESSFDGFTDTIVITPSLSQASADLLKKLKRNGKGAYVYTPRNESDADFCCIITRTMTKNQVGSEQQ